MPNEEKVSILVSQLGVLDLNASALMKNEEKVNILVVDDLPEKLMVLETVLEGLGQNVVTANSGREALRRLLDQEFAVILLDINMPDIDGLETAAMIRSRRQTALTPIIFVTAFSDEMHTAQGYSLAQSITSSRPSCPKFSAPRSGSLSTSTKKRGRSSGRPSSGSPWPKSKRPRPRRRPLGARFSSTKQAPSSFASWIMTRSLAPWPSKRFRFSANSALLRSSTATVPTIGAPSWSGSTPTPRITPGSPRRAPPLPCVSAAFRGVIETGETQFLTELAGEPKPSDEPSSSPAPDEPAVPFEPHSLLLIPLRARGRTLGTIALALRSPNRRFGPADRTLADELANRAAIAIDNARLYRDIQENDRRKNEFLAMLGHELRNPLAPIRHAVEVLRMRDFQDSDLKWANDVIARQVEQMARMVDDLLDISRISGGKIQLRKELFDVSLAIARAVETSRPLIDARRHELEVLPPDGPVVVDGDLVRLAQVLSNLLNNAAKYTPEGGKITLHVAREGSDVVFQIRDNGVGIVPEMLPRVFDLFAQADRSLDRSQGGLGIGLTLVRRLVELHGGSVEARSRGANQGSEFLIRLPVSTGRPVAPEIGNGARPKPRVCAPRRILIVEDLPDVARSLARLLRLAGHEVTTAADGHTALAELDTFQPEVVLLDIGLPGMDGYEVARNLRQRPGSDSIVLVALTGYGQDDDRHRSRAAGFDFHLIKPVDVDALFSLLESAEKRGTLPLAQTLSGV